MRCNISKHKVFYIKYSIYKKNYVKIYKLLSTDLQQFTRIVIINLSLILKLCGKNTKCCSKDKPHISVIEFGDETCWHNFRTWKLR